MNQLTNRSKIPMHAPGWYACGAADSKLETPCIEETLYHWSLKQRDNIYFASALGRNLQAIIL